MSQATEETKSEIQKGLASLYTLRDEIRVRLHLAGMEVKDVWNKTLEPQLLDAEKFAEEVTETSKEKLDALVTRMKEFQASLGESKDDTQKH
ncbi:hypothetical protein [Chondromyces crocatus]|uniref:Uncharacterized protein n=1 Tax=Chondromyces crocatus TaxID=52 RepID=A0A0K1EPU8_CHOCO|nr:hypothetical protein [Chondromyces crocatus]AKT42633.1 uncharacterized protein CMC5_068600 [Chondromyces crocatus]